MNPVNAYFRVNDLAPRDDKLSAFFKKVGEKKSDGFALIENGEIYIIDSGLKDDDGVLEYLLSLREKWLSEKPDLVENQNARLEINIIVSHPHPDHIGSMPAILCDPRICVQSLYAPMRSQQSTVTPVTIPELAMYEDTLDEFPTHLAAYNHTARQIYRLPYGKTLSIPMGVNGTLLTLYTAPYDWSEDRPSESEGLRFLKKFVSPTYQGRATLSYTNGILNGNSLWVKVTKGNQAVLFTGDQRASDEMLGAMIRYYGEAEFDSDILKITHHGEGNYCPQLLAAANPKITIFTAAHGKSTPETEELCKQRGAERYYLCDGNLLFTLDGNSITSEGIQSR